MVETHELLEAVLSYWSDLEGEDRDAFRFLHVSTDEVYGTLGPEGYFTEESPYRPNSPYAASKAASDHLVRAYHHTYGLPTLTTNCSNNYGPYHFPEKLIPLMILTAMRENPCPSTATGSRSGTGSTSRTTARLSSLCSSAAVRGDVQRRRPQRADEPRGRQDHLRPARRAGPRDRRTSRSSPSLRTGRATTTLCHRRGKIERELGWRPEETLETGLEKTVRWYLENRGWCEAALSRGYRESGWAAAEGRREGDRARRGLGYAAVSAHEGGKQAAPARLRQADDLLPLTTLMLAGIRDILVISTPEDLPRFEDLLGDGSQWGVDFQLRRAAEPEGLAQAFVIGRFVGSESVSSSSETTSSSGTASPSSWSGRQAGGGATVFGYYVRDPGRYGVVEFDGDGTVLSIEEKPESPRSHYAVTGLYFYDNRVLDVAADLAPSARGEFEITDVNVDYLERGELQVELMGRGMAWLDAGTHESLHQSSNFIETIEQRQGLKIGCPEEISYRKGYIDAESLERLAHPMRKNDYGQYLLELLKSEEYVR